jgi:hypothetical protein
MGDRGEVPNASIAAESESEEVPSFGVVVVIIAVMRAIAAPAQRLRFPQKNFCER